MSRACQGVLIVVVLLFFLTVFKSCTNPVAIFPRLAFLVDIQTPPMAGVTFHKSHKKKIKTKVIIWKYTSIIMPKVVHFKMNPQLLLSVGVKNRIQEDLGFNDPQKKKRGFLFSLFFFEMDYFKHKSVLPSCGR